MCFYVEKRKKGILDIFVDFNVNPDTIGDKKR